MIHAFPRFLTATIVALACSAATAFAEPPAEPRVLNYEELGKEIGKRGGTLRMLMAKGKDISQMTIYGNARLVIYDQNFQLQPDILKSIDVEGNRVFTFALREGHKWSDGQPFTSEDFRYWWEDVANNPTITKGGPPQALLVGGKPPKFEVIDERTVRYSWDEPNPLFLTSLAGARPTYIYQAAHYMKQFHEKYADPAKLAALVEAEKVQNWGSLHIRKGRQYRPENPDNPTLQPWMNTSPAPAERFVFVRNPHFHRVDPAGTQLPYFDDVIINLASSSVIAAKAGTGDSDLQGRYIKIEDFPFLKKGEKDGDYRVLLWSSGRGSERVLLPNLNASDPELRDAMRDVRVRRAMSLAIDREEINEAIFLGQGRPAANYVLPESPLYTDAMAEAFAQRDLDKANALLDEAGYDKRDSSGFRLLPDGRKFEIIVETAGESSQETDILQLITDHLSEVGISMFVKPGQRDILRSRVGNGDVVMSTWSGLNRGLATSDMNPEELAPVSSVQAQWPVWGRYFETKGASGEAPTMPEVAKLASLYEEWRTAESSEEQSRIWAEMLSIYTDQVFTIGTVSGAVQPIVVNKKMRNIPDKGIWAFEPTHYFGHYMPDTFFYAE
ncbi:ABC transporter substrate-binding protein [Pseudahrensia aquimaris]|uniref:ABC transporter substrate-binding protein n=1 Tax=Pseudahrensia aquimaris TaxID=744461 RepID=A0ABW3FBZ0_9HYPH